MTVARIIPKRIRDQQDANLTLGAGTDGYGIAYNHTTGLFEMAALESAGVASGLITAHVGLSNPHTQYLLASGYTAADLLSKLLTVDGGGSGLDADLLDGLSSAAFEAVGTAAGLITAHVAAANPHSQYTLASSFTTHQALTTAHGISAYGATLVDDADASAARGTLGLGTMATAAEANYLLATGTRTGATSQAQTFTNGIIGPSWRPASDSTPALQMQNAAGTAIVTIDTTNQKLILPANRVVEWGTSGRTPYVRGNNSGYFEVGDNVAGVFFYYDVATAALAGTHMKSVRFPAAGNLTLIGNTNAQDFVTVGGAGHSILGFNHYGQFRITFSGGTQLGIDNVGQVFIGQATATALLDIAASTSARASLRIRSGTWPTTPNDGDIANNGNAIAMMVNGTNAVNTEGGLSIWMQSSTTARNVGRLLWQYTDKTDATRATRGSVTAFHTSTEHKPVTWGANSGGALLSFYDITTPIARQVLATGAGRTADDIITTLQALGLVKQS